MKIKEVKRMKKIKQILSLVRVIAFSLMAWSMVFADDTGTKVKY